MPNRSLAVASPSVAASIGRYRWVICALLFFATTINYVDRQVIGILKTTLQKEFGWSEIDYADIIFAFQLAYALAFLFAGRMIDWLGTKKGYIVALVIWSLAAMAHAEAPVFGPTVASILAVVGLTLQRVGRGIHLCPALARVRRSRQFPGGDQSDGRVVPEKGARARHRDLQFRHQRRGGPHAAGRALDHAVLGMVLGVHHHRRARFPLAVLLDSDLPLARTPPERRRRGACPHPK